ncbi:MAG: PKD domain-containing protein [Thermoplasmata archaeon]|nr:PKD domain-containing protein [Thermoplasmata archaeon]
MAHRSPPSDCSPPIASRPVVLALLLSLIVGATGIASVGALGSHAGALVSSPLGEQRWFATPPHSAGPQAMTHQAGALAVPTSPGGYLWSNLSTSLSIAPSARVTTMTWDAADGYVLLFGGLLISSAHPTDTWIFANGTWTNITGQVTGTPPALGFPVLAYDPTSTAVVLYGQLASGALTTVTWTYHNKVWTNVTASAGTEPSPRTNVAFTQDSTDSGLLLFGGRPAAASGILGDTWTFKANHWTNITATAGWSFGGVATPTASDDPPDHGVLMFGYNLLNSTTVRPATYLYTAGNWQNLTASIPVQPIVGLYPQSQYLPSLRSVVVYQPDFVTKAGGIAFSATTISFAGGAWTNLTLLVAGPPGGVGFLGTTAAIGGGAGILGFGGLLANGQYSSYTWILSGTPLVSANASRTVVDTGGTVSFTGSASGGATPLTLHWNFGDGSNSSVLSPSHAFVSPGLHLVTFTGTDLVGRAASASLAIEVNAALSSSVLALPNPSAVGSSVGMVAQVSGGTAPYSYHWALGDTTSATTASVTHAYSKPGNYTVTLNLTDALGGSVSSSATVTVKANATGNLGTTPVTSGGSSVSLTSGTGLYLLLGIVLLAAIVVALAVMLARRPKSPSGPAAAYAPGQGGVPPAASQGSGPPPSAGATNTPN